ncbi:MAG: NAD-dependent epimerase/dehydratase family protein [Solirubrobacteraceae bacterium]|nr:NAD-dependent epimerase/dehydratase family protein [Solirubrobacteraceae bacterium]
MSTGSKTTLLLKASPEAGQIAERLDGGDWQGIELCLMGSQISDDAALERAIEISKAELPDGVTVTAEAPVSWPSGAFVRVDTLDDEAKAGIERSARFAAAVGSPVLTIHLFIPITPEEMRRGEPVHDPAVQEFLSFYAGACLDAGITPLIENVPPVLRMREGGFFLSPIGGHWQDLLRWGDAIPELGFTFDTSHAALFRNFAAAYPGVFGLDGDEGLELERYVEKLGPRSDVAHVSNASGLLGEGLSYDEGELDLDPVVRQLADLVSYIVAEINEPDHSKSPNMKAGYRAIEKALSGPAGDPPAPRRRPLADEPFDWQAVVGERDPVPSILELQEKFGGRRILITGGCGSIGSRLATLLDGIRPEQVTLLDTHEAAITADMRARAGTSPVPYEHVLCDVRDRARVFEEIERARPDAIFHLAAYKHVNLAEQYPEEFVATNLEGSLNILDAATEADVGTVVVASTDKAAPTASFYGRTKRMMEQITQLTGGPDADRVAVRLVNVLGSAGSASDLFLRQARADVPLTITDTSMERFWITLEAASALLAHGGLVGTEGVRLVSVADPVVMNVGELATRIWHQTGHDSDPEMAMLGVRPGEVMREVLTGPGESLGQELRQGTAAIEGLEPSQAVATLLDELAATEGTAERRALWLDAIQSPDTFPTG